MAKNKRWFRSGLVAGTVLFGALALLVAEQGAREGGGGGLLGSTWSLHQIVVGVSGSGQPDGADGIDMVDIDGDGLLDAVSGHEQGLRLTVSFNPGTDDAAVESAWPTVTLPDGVNMCSVEDAIACDVDADGALDIVAACETGAQRVEVMFAPAPPNTRGELLNAANWTRVTLDASVNRRSMRVACADMEGDNSLELVVGEKDAGVASFLGYYVSETPRTGASWTHVNVVPVGWVMQMFVTDFDGDADLDIVYSDKEDIATGTPDATKRGVRWLESDGLDPPSFVEWPISTIEGQWKWFDIVDWDSDADLDVVACRSEPPTINEQALFQRDDAAGEDWTEVSLPLPAGTGTCQHTTAVDIDLDGVLDIGTAYSQSSALQGMTWQKQTAPGVFSTGRLSGVLSATDTKFDNLAWIDVDADGDKDAVTTEQHIPAGTGPGLGVVYFENPRNTFVPSVAPPAVNCAVLTSGTAGGGTTGTTASVSPGANRAIYVAVQTALAAGPAAPTSVVGNGITYTQEETVQFHTANTRRLTVFRGMSATPSAGTIVATYAVSQTSYIWSVIECDGVDTGGTNASAATVQSTTNTAAASTSVTGTLAALGAASSVHLAFSGISINGAQAPDADFAELSDNATGTGTGGLEAEWATNETTVTPTFSSANAGVISLEVKIAP